MSAMVDEEPMRDAATRLFEAVGVTETDAKLIADSLVQAELWGHHSHGLLRLPWYVARIRSGAMKVDTRGSVLVDTGALLLLDGEDGIGQVVTEHARELAVARAKEHGIGAVGVRRSNHFGTAMYFTRRAAADGCVAILTTNASAAMAPWGGREKRVGTNPWSIAAPWGDRAVAVDIANTAVARGKIYLAKERGTAIPDTWALGPDGSKTSDPTEGIEGTILPMGGHKGYAISFMMDVLSGALTGSSIGSEVVGPYVPDGSSGAGHLFIAIDVAAFGEPDEFGQRVGAIVDDVRSTPLAVGHDRIYYPGEIEDLAEASARSAGGIVIAQQTIEDLNQLADDLGVELPVAWPDIARDKESA